MTICLSTRLLNDRLTLLSAAINRELVAAGRADVAALLPKTARDAAELLLALPADVRIEWQEVK